VKGKEATLSIDLRWFLISFSGFDRAAPQLLTDNLHYVNPGPEEMDFSKWLNW
jgi:hypothetical protein